MNTTMQRIWLNDFLDLISNLSNKGYDIKIKKGRLFIGRPVQKIRFEDKRDYGLVLGDRQFYEQMAELVVDYYPLSQSGDFELDFKKEGLSELEIKQWIEELIKQKVKLTDDTFKVIEWIRLMK